MEKKIYRIRIILSVIALVLFLALDYIPVSAAGLKTIEVKDKQISGVFTLFLYGGRYSNDVETIAIFDKEGDRYTFDIFAPDFDYKVKKDLEAKEALAYAEHFVSGHSSFQRSQLSRIIDDKGETIGYELRPLYFPLTFGVDDVLDVDYILKGNKVTVKVRLVPSVERSIRDGDNLLNRH